jgi:hypothetical protein
MRILILPLVIVFLCSSIDGFSQGANCGNAFDISNTCATPATVSATTGNPLTGTTCSGAGRITWLKFVAGSTCPVLSFDITTSTSFQVAAYTNCDVAGVESGLVAGTTACFGSARGVWSPSAALTNGVTYYLRVWTNSTGTIRACNIASSANSLDVDGGCESFAMATTQGFPVGTCATNAQRNVTWFKFVASATCPMLSIDNSNSIGTGASAVANEVSLYPACGNANATLSPIAAATTCVANGSTLWSPPSGTLVAGNTYYLRVWTNTSSAGNLNICNIENVAQDLPLNQSCNDYDLSYSSSGGTVSNIANCPMATNANRRVTWIRFKTSAANNCVTVNVTDPGSRKTEVALFGSGCGAAIKTGTSLCLNDGVGVWSAGPGFPTNGYTPNVDYYLRIYSDAPTDGSYQYVTLCGTEKSQAINDDCANASAFNYTPGSYNNACAHFVNNEGLANGNGTEAAKICAYSMQNTVWYKFKVRNGADGRASVTISNIDCDSYNGNSQLLQMGLLTGTCNSFAPAISPGPSGSPAFPTNNTLATPTSCLATNGTGPYNLYTSATVATNQIIYLAIDGYSGANCRFTLQASQNIQPIPIHLKYFTAWKKKESNLIRWITSWEHNNAYFDLERSIDGTNFESIGRVPGTESQSDKVYDFEDKYPPAVAYYRLKQVDIDGKFEYSDIVQLVRDENIRFAVSAMPNPVQSSIRIIISSEKAGNVSLNVLDAAGRQVLSDVISCVKGNNTIMRDFSRLPAGTYHIAVVQNGNRVVKTFVKQ